MVERFTVDIPLFKSNVQISKARKIVTTKKHLPALELHSFTLHWQALHHRHDTSINRSFQKILRSSSSGGKFAGNLVH
jgi:hypothetical protein